MTDTPKDQIKAQPMIGRRDGKMVRSDTGEEVTEEQFVAQVEAMVRRAELPSSAFAVPITDEDRQAHAEARLDFSRAKPGPKWMRDGGYYAHPETGEPMTIEEAAGYLVSMVRKPDPDARDGL